jgi:hypothetical protein
MIRPWALLVLLVLLAATPAAGQVIFSQQFDGNTAGWTMTGLWRIDGTPAGMPGGASFSGARSLNFNNGVDFAGLQRGTAQSPAVRAQAAVAHALTFRCNYRTETTGPTYDTRTVVIRVNGTAVSTNRLAGTSTTPVARRCAAMGTWHAHEIAIAAPAGGAPPTINVEFAFDSVDATANGFQGWFIDNVEVVQRGGGTPAPVFTTVTRTTSDFRQYTATTRIAANGSVEVLQSSPTARYAPVTGQATAAELQALTQAITSANLATIPAQIPDPNTYIVAPTSVVLDVVSTIPANDNTISASLGVYGQWAPRLSPVVAAVQTIQERLLAGPTPNPTADDHGNTPATATTLDAAVPQATAGKVEAAGDVDFFKVTDGSPVILIYPPPQRTYTVETTVVGDMDTIIDLYAADGTTLITSNDDFQGGGLASRVVTTTQHGGALYAKVRHYSASKTGSYTVRVTGSAPGNPNPNPAQDDHGNSPGQATELSVGNPAMAGNIGAAGDVDFFLFSQIGIMIFPPPPATFVIQTTVTGSSDTVIDLYAADGTTLLATNDDGPGLGYASKIVYNGVVGTGYYVRVRHYSSTGTGGYTISVSTAP